MDDAFGCLIGCLAIFAFLAAIAIIAGLGYLTLSVIAALF